MSKYYAQPQTPKYYYQAEPVQEYAVQQPRYVEQRPVELQEARSPVPAFPYGDPQFVSQTQPAYGYQVDPRMVDQRQTGLNRYDQIGYEDQSYNYSRNVPTQYYDDSRQQPHYLREMTTSPQKIQYERQEYPQNRRYDQYEEPRSSGYYNRGSRQPEANWYVQDYVEDQQLDVQRQGKYNRRGDYIPYNEKADRYAQHRSQPVASKRYYVEDSRPRYYEHEPRRHEYNGKSKPRADHYSFDDMRNALPTYNDYDRRVQRQDSKLYKMSKENRAYNYGRGRY